MINISPVAQTETNFKDKKTILIITIAILLVAFVVYSVYLIKQREIKEKPVIETGDQKVQRQLQELDVLRVEARTAPLTEKQIETQMKELDALRAKVVTPTGSKSKMPTTPKPLTDVEIQKQLEELDKLRSSSQ